MTDFMGTVVPITDLGFTGTRMGMTQDQAYVVEELLHELHISERVHHGDCIGADAQFHDLVRAHRPDLTIVGHPPEDDKYRAFTECDIWMPTLPYLKRDKEIVNAVMFLIATPRGSEQRRSGTWATIRYARNREIERRIVMPNGRLVDD